MSSHRRTALDTAERQCGVLTRWQARLAGLTEHQVDHAITDGWLTPVARGVYRIRGVPQNEQMAVAAAVLRASGRASHATAARLLRLDAPLGPAPIHVTVDAGDCHPRGGRIAVADAHLQRTFFSVQVHRSLSVRDPVCVVDGLPCSDGARTLIEVAPVLSASDLETAFERARRLGLVSTESLARRFGELGGSGRPGTPKVRRLLADAAPNPLDSKLEVLGWRLLRSSSLPGAVRQLPVHAGTHRHRLDFAWPEFGVAFETEGFEWHGGRGRWKQDRQRTARLELLGWRIVVGTWEDVTRSPDGTVARIAAALSERRALRAS